MVSCRNITFIFGFVILISLLIVWKWNMQATITRESVWLSSRAHPKEKDYGDNTCGQHPSLYEYRELFHYWVNLANRLNITYFLTCGTLLGAWRDEQLIPWDHDMDILMFSEDTIKLDRIRDKRPLNLYDNKFRVVLQEDWRLPIKKRRILTCSNVTVPRYSSLCGFKGVVGRILRRLTYIDIYSYTIKDGNITDAASAKRYKLKDVYPLKKCNFMKIETICPKEPVVILKELYGNQLIPNRKCKNRTWVDVEMETFEIENLAEINVG